MGKENLLLESEGGVLGPFQRGLVVAPASAPCLETGQPMTQLPSASTPDLVILTVRTQGGRETAVGKGAQLGLDPAATACPAPVLGTGPGPPSRQSKGPTDVPLRAALARGAGAWSLPPS